MGIITRIRVSRRQRPREDLLSTCFDDEITVSIVLDDFHFPVSVRSRAERRISCVVHVRVRAVSSLAAIVVLIPDCGSSHCSASNENRSLVESSEGLYLVPQLDLLLLNDEKLILKSLQSSFVSLLVFQFFRELESTFEE